MMEGGGNAALPSTTTRVPAFLFGIMTEEIEMTTVLPRPKRTNVLLAALVAHFVTAATGSPAVAQAAVPAEKSNATPSADPIVNLNESSRMLYTLAKQKALAAVGPVIIVIGDDVVLRKGHKRTRARFIPEIYHTLKAFSHVPLAIDVTLAAHASQSPLSEDVLSDLREYRGLFSAAAGRMASAGLNSEERERQKTILAASASFLETVIEKRHCSAEERMAFTRRMTPLVMANASAAAGAALQALHRQVSAWKGQLTPEEWSRLTVLVIGRQMPRNDNLAVQYFARLLNQPGEGNRIIYAEGLAEEPRALDLLATHRVDTQVGIDFFDDPLRMYRDLLCDGAREYLPRLFGQPR
jgi:hypothetical protein